MSVVLTQLDFFARLFASGEAHRSDSTRPPDIPEPPPEALASGAVSCYGGGGSGHRGEPPVIPQSVMQLGG